MKLTVRKGDLDKLQEVLRSCGYGNAGVVKEQRDMVFLDLQHDQLPGKDSLVPYLWKEGVSSVK